MSGFDMVGKVHGVSKYDTMNNIVLCGNDKKPSKQMAPLQELCKQVLKFPELGLSIPIQGQSLNNDVNVPPNFVVNSGTQYWPPSQNYAPQQHDRFQWERPYEDYVMEQSCRPYTLGTEPIDQHNQNFNICTGSTQNIHFLGNGSMPVNNQPSFGTSLTQCGIQACNVCTGQILQNNPYYVQTGPVPQIHQTFNFGPGLIPNNVQHNDGTSVMHNNINVLPRSTAQYANQLFYVGVPTNKSYDVSTETKTSNHNFAITTETKTYNQPGPNARNKAPTTVTKIAPSSSDVQSSDNTKLHLTPTIKIPKCIKEVKSPTLNNDVSPTRVKNSAIPIIQDKNKYFMKIDSDLKQEVNNCPLQRIKLANGEIIHSKKIERMFDGDKQNSKDQQDSKSKTKYNAQHKVKESNIQPVARKTKKLIKKSNQKSELIKKLQLKLQMVNDEISKRQKELEIKNSLIEQELAATNVTQLSSSHEDQKCEDTKDHQIKIRKRSELSTRDAIEKKITHSEPCFSQKDKKMFQTSIKDPDEKPFKKSSFKDLKSVVKVVKHSRNPQPITNKSQHTKENYRSHKDKYYIIREKDVCRSVHKSNDPSKENVDVNKCKLKWKNAVYNTNKHDNLLIMFDNDMQEEQTKERKVKVQKRKKSSHENGNPTKIKKIQLVINVIPEKSKQENDSSLQSESFSDLSFLDGINADEIVEYLNTYEKQMAICESDISAATLDSSNAFHDITSPKSLTIDETMKDKLNEHEIDNQSNDTWIIDLKTERLEDNLNNSEIKTQELTTINAILTPVLTKHEMYTEDQRVSSPIEAATLLSAEKIQEVNLNVPKATANQSINVSLEIDEICKEYIDDSSKFSEINNNDVTTKQNKLIIATDHSTARITTRCDDQARTLAVKENILEESVIIIDDEPPVLITIDETQEIITITDDDYQERAAIKDEPLKMNQEQSEIIIIDDDMPEAMTSSFKGEFTEPTIVKSEDGMESKSNSTIQAQVNKDKLTETDTKKKSPNSAEIEIIYDKQKTVKSEQETPDDIAGTGSVVSDNIDAQRIEHEEKSLPNSTEIEIIYNKQKIVKSEQETREDIAGTGSVVSENIDAQRIKNQEKSLPNSNASYTPANKELDKEVFVEKEAPQSFEKSNLNTGFCFDASNSTANSSTSEESNVRIGGIILSIKDLLAEIESIETSFEDKKHATNVSKTTNNIGECRKFPCKFLHKILEKQEPLTVLKSCSTDTKKTKNILCTEKYLKEQIKKKGENLLSDYEFSILEEMTLAQRLEDRVSEYVNLNLTVVSVLHRGTFSIIFNCLDGENKNVAAKIATKGISPSVISGYEKETMLTKMQKNILQENLGFVYIINGLAVDRKWCLLMDYYPKNLEQALRESGKGFKLDLVKKFAKQLISAVAMLKNNGIVHSDINPSHILMDGNNTTLKLCGFDESYYVNKARKVSNIGTIHYRAPEIILGHSAGHSIDVWASALVIYEMATNQKLFPATSNNEVLYQQMRAFGAAPCSMVKESAFKNAHFVGQNFLRRHFTKENNAMKNEVITAFPKNDIMIRSILEAYVHNWSTGPNKLQKDNDVVVLHQICGVLMQMLVLDPTRRASILDVNIS